MTVPSASISNAVGFVCVQGAGVVSLMIGVPLGELFVLIGALDGALLQNMAAMQILRTVAA